MIMMNHMPYISNIVTELCDDSDLPKHVFRVIQIQCQNRGAKKLQSTQKSKGTKSGLMNIGRKA